MHDSIALMEASCGRVEEARRHLWITAGILERHPNAWLQQISLVSSFFLDFVDCRYDDAVHSLGLARDLASIVGAGLLPIIDCNEGHALAIVGRFGVAEQSLRKVTESDSPQFVLGALDGLARLYLSIGRIPECEEALSRSKSLVAESSAVASAFAGRWTAVTRAKLLLQKECFPEALEAISRDVQHARRIEDKMLLAALQFLQSEALAGMGQPTAALRVLFPFGTQNGVLPPGQQANCYRAAGVASARWCSTAAELMFNRTSALCRQHGNQQGEVELRQFDTVREIARTAAAPSVGAAVAFRATDALAASLNLADNRPLLGRELLNAIDALECSPRATLLESKLEVSRGGLSADTYSLVLGEHRGKSLALVCAIPSDPEKALALANVLRVGHAAIALERAREEEKSRAAMWPPDQVEVQAGALFIAEEMQTLLATARRVAGTNVPVLITGLKRPQSKAADTGCRPSARNSQSLLRARRSAGLLRAA